MKDFYPFEAIKGSQIERNLLQTLITVKGKYS